MAEVVASQADVQGSSEAEMWAAFENEFRDERQIPIIGVQAFTERILEDAAQETDSNVRESAISFTTLLNSGGKRLRGILAARGYRMYGGTDPHVMETIAGLFEVWHAYLLVVDDVADKSELRRGEPTAHMYLRNLFVEQGMPAKDAKKLGEDMAITAALTAQHKAMAMISELDVPDERKTLATKILHEGLAGTGFGQLRDMAPKDYSNIDIEEILETLRRKTELYTFLLPLQVGAALAGATMEDLEVLQEYSKNAGLAFQLVDDIIGTFGDEETIGKSPKSDIEEGKLTYLVARALEYGDKAEERALLRALKGTRWQRLLSRFLGKRTLSDRQFIRCRTILDETGALDETGRMALDCADAAIASLNENMAEHGWERGHVNFLGNVAMAAVKRGS